MFTFLKKMADLDKIHILNLNLSDQEGIKNLVEQIRNLHTQLGIVDLSNIVDLDDYVRESLFFSDFIKQQDFVNSMTALSQVTHERAFFLGTIFHSPSVGWKYRALEFSGLLPLEDSVANEGGGSVSVASRNPHDWMIYLSEAGKSLTLAEYLSICEAKQFAVLSEMRGKPKVLELNSVPAELK